MHNLRAKCIGKNFKLIVIVRQGRSREKRGMKGGGGGLQTVGAEVKH